jgi:zinc transporter 1
VVSIAVAYYALHLATNTSASSTYTYGLQRAEVLGALINAVSLLTLCFTIIIEAIQRLFEPVHIQHPVLVIIVGSVGLAFNLIGMGMFHGIFFLSSLKFRGSWSLFVFQLIINSN